MITQPFRIISSLLGNNKNTRKHAHSRGRSLRGFENLERREMMTAVPAFSSLPGAPVTIYLDFDGHHEDRWGEVRFEDADFIRENVNVPVFSIDGDSNFNALELQMIHQTWMSVAEDFAPFNVNVTTVCPSDFSDGKAMRVAIGGHYTDWYGFDSGGVSMPNSFHVAEYVNTAFVFAEQYDSGRKLADGISHEVGHMLGLEHQSLWNTYDGELIAEYNTGNPEVAPIMGASYWSDRSLWWNDPYGQTGWHGQDDIAMLTGDIGGLSFRADDHGGTYQTATRINNLNGATKGVITSNATNVNAPNDRDAFIVTLPSAGVMRQWSVSVDVDAYSANLDAKIEVYKFVGPIGKNGQYAKPPQLVGVADPGDDLGAFFSIGGATGTFMIVVSSHGGYGDLGQYTLSLQQQLGNTPNVDPIFTLPIIDVVSGPLGPVVLPGQNGMRVDAITSLLNLNNSTSVKRASTGQVANLNPTKTSPSPTLGGFEALDLAFANFGKPGRVV